MTVHSTPLSVPGFSPAFWQSYVPVTGRPDAAGGIDTAGAPALSYSPQLHGTHADFCQGDGFAQYREQVRDSLAFLADFCWQHDMPEAHQIEQNFNTFFAHRFVDHHYFDKRAEIVDSVGKRALDEFCSMIRNEANDLGRRKAAIRDLSYGVTLCADGAVSNLVCAAGMLAKTIGGIRGKLWALKEETAANIFRQLVDLEFGHKVGYLGNEIHYVNTVWNILADQFGLEKIPDGITMAEITQDGDFLATCVARLSGALRPDRLAMLMAEACQARFNSQMAMESLPATGRWHPSVEKRFSEILEDIGNEFGLTSDDGLEFAGVAKIPTLRDSDLRIKSFLDIAEDPSNDTQTEQDARAAETRGDEGGYTYAVRTEPSLISLDVLRAMSRLRLLQAETAPRSVGEWKDESGWRAALFVYGELAWVARTPGGGAFQDPVLSSGNAELHPVTVADLLLWEATRDNEAHIPPMAALGLAIEATVPQHLTQMPVHWLTEAVHLQRFVQRLGPDHAAGYLEQHLTSLRLLGARLAQDARKDVLTQLVRVGQCNAVVQLAGHWFPDELTCGNMMHALLLREVMPGFHKALLAQDPSTAVQHWYRPLRESRLFTLAAPRLADLLDVWYTTSPILAHMINSNCAGGVEAFYAVLKDMLKDPTVRWHMKDELPLLLAALDCYDIPALSNAMACGYIDVIRAYYAGLKDLMTDPVLAVMLRPALLQDLPNLLVGKKRNGESGLGFALEKGNSGVIVALHDILKELLSLPRIAPRVQGALPDLLAARTAWGASNLSHAMLFNCPTALRAFFDILKDPIIIPHVVGSMQDVLNGRDADGKTGLSNALGNGLAEVIQAYHQLLAYLLNDPAIAPHIQPIVPHLVSIRNKDRTSGLAYVTREAQFPAMRAFFAMLNDPAIAPYTNEDMSLLRGAQWQHKAEAAASNQAYRG